MLSLRQRLLDKVDFYLKKDNPKPLKPKDLPERVTGFICTLFSHRGALGRHRAESYQKILGEYQDNTLLHAVLNDILNHLGTSEKLRERLLEGLCEHYRIPLDAINREVLRACGPVLKHAGYPAVALTARTLKTKYILNVFAELLRKESETNPHMTIAVLPRGSQA